MNENELEGCIIWKPRLSEQSFVSTYLVNLFHWLSENFDLLVAVDEKSINCQTIMIHPLGTMNF